MADLILDPRESQNTIVKRKKPVEKKLPKPAEVPIPSILKPNELNFLHDIASKIKENGINGNLDKKPQVESEQMEVRNPKLSNNTKG